MMPVVSMRLPVALCLLACGLAGLVLAVLVQFEPACAAWFFPDGLDPVLVRTFVVADLVLLGATPLSAARRVITGRSSGYAALCIYCGAISYASLWAWTAVAVTGAGLVGALVSTPGALVAGWAVIVLRPGVPEPRFVRAADRTTPPGRLVVLFDGSCRFCRAGVAALEARTHKDAFVPLDLHDPSVPGRFPGLPEAALMRAMHVVHPDGRVEAGAPAVLAALSSKPVFRVLHALYRVPGATAVVDVLYALIARLRSRLPGRTCDGGACRIHPAPQSGDTGARPDSRNPTA